MPLESESDLRHGRSSPLASPADQAIVLIVEDSPTLSELYRSFLADEKLDVQIAATGAAAIEAIDHMAPAVIFLDLQLPDMDGIEILRRARDQGSTASIVVMTAHGSVQRAVEVMQAGADDFLVKPFDRDRLLATLRNHLEKKKLADLVHEYQSQSRASLEGMIGRSLAMQAVYKTIESAAPSKATIFITGPSGTGKELCAQAIHRLSPRAEKPFVAINCAAIPRDLMESELFGHVAGAFTGAHKDRMGAAAQANHGTLFLDEICELDFDLQAKLLRFIQLENYRRVGGTKTEQADIRFVCATNRDPLEEVKAKRFREDLYYRLHVIPIEMPALSERGDDVLLLAQYFLDLFSAKEGKSFEGFDESASEVLLSYSWPGNVRELQNVIRQLTVLQSGGIVKASMLSIDLGEGKLVTRSSAKAAGLERKTESLPHPSAEVNGRGTPSVLRPLWRIEKEAILSALDLYDGDIQKAAVALELSPSTIYRKLQAWQKEEAAES